MLSGSDSYYRVAPSHASPSIQLTGSGDVAFIDLDIPDPTVLFRIDDWLVDLIPTLVNYRTVVFRWPQVTGTTRRLSDGTPPTDFDVMEAEERAMAWLRRSRLKRLNALQAERVCVLIHTLGGRPRLVSVDATGDEISLDDAPWANSLVRRCRSSEVRALLKNGRAQWQPPGYHFRLPSGMHSGSFIRLADSIRSPRDAFVLTTWLAQHLADDQGMLVDTASLTPIVVQAQGLLARAGWRAGPVAILDDYPRTRLGAKQAARHAVGRSGMILGIVSVSSSGRLCDLFSEAIEAASPRSWSLQVIIDKSSGLTDTPNMDSWLCIDDPILDVGPESCALCRDPKRSRVVSIDPVSFELFQLPSPERLIPDLEVVRLNRSFWELAASTRAVGLSTSPSERSGPRPRYGKLGVRVFYDRMFGDGAGLQHAVRQRIAASPSGAVESENRAKLARLSSVDLVVLGLADSQSIEGEGIANERYRPLLQEIGISSSAPIIEVDSTIELSGETKPAHVLVLAQGSVTGWSIRRLHDIVCSAFGRQVVVSALVVHSRPVSSEDWELAIAPFSGDCSYIWQTYLPWDTPLLREAQMLEEFLADEQSQRLSAEASVFLHKRRELVNPADNYLDWDLRVSAFEDGKMSSDPRCVFWGLRSFDDIISDGFVGNGVAAVEVFVGLGSAIQASRVRTRRDVGSLWCVLDFSQLSRFRFDATMTSAVLRWTTAAEAWWGATPIEARATVAALLESARREGEAAYRVLVGESLLAAAEGKVDAAAAEVLLGHAERISSEPEIELGLRLYEWARPSSIDGGSLSRQ